MSDRSNKMSRYHAAGPRVYLRRIDEIRTLEIMVTDLDNLDQIVAKEMQALGFASAALGVFAGAVLGWVAAGQMGGPATSFYALTTAFSGTAMLWFGIAWRRESRSRATLRERLIGQTQRQIISEADAED